MTHSRNTSLFCCSSYVPLFPLSLGEMNCFPTGRSLHSLVLSHAISKRSFSYSSHTAPSCLTKLDFPPSEAPQPLPSAPEQTPVTSIFINLNLHQPYRSGFKPVKANSVWFKSNTWSIRIGHNPACRTCVYVYIFQRFQLRSRASSSKEGRHEFAWSHVFSDDRLKMPTCGIVTRDHYHSLIFNL
jgi:hypothetical protein